MEFQSPAERNTPTLKVRPEGGPWVLGAGIPTLILYGLWVWFDSLWFMPGFVIAATLTVFLLYFFRDPPRDPDSADPHDWLAPADGLVTDVRTDEEGNHRIVIFLTVFNVHVNRMPVEGRVEEIDYRSGQFLPAFKKDLGQANEQNRLRCRDRRGRSFEIHQIAGMLARRIHCWVHPDDDFERGERFGMIALGSRTDLILPPEAEPVVELRQAVRGGQTVVARER